VYNRLTCSRYERSIKYAGKLGDMVMLMGNERVVPKGSAPMAGKEVRRRFTDTWKMVSGPLGFSSEASHHHCAVGKRQLRQILAFQDEDVEGVMGDLGLG
jgi:hypothetical protein